MAPEECMAECLEADGTNDAICTERCAEGAAPAVDAPLSPEECMDECLEAEGTDEAICTERCAEEG